MINIKHLHWLFKERMNRGSSNTYQDFTSAEIDQFINDSARMVAKPLGENEGAVIGVDFSGSLLVTRSEQPSIVPNKIEDGRYELKLASLKHEYLRYKRLSLNQGCGLVKVIMEGSGRLNDILDDHLQRPSKKWRRVYGYVARASTGVGRSIYLLCESGSLITSVDIEYLRYPKKVFFGGYNTVEYQDCVQRGGLNCTSYYSETSPIQDLEFDEMYASLIVDYAVAEAKRVIENPQGLNLATEKLTRLIQ